MERYPSEVTKMASNIKKNPDLVPKKQGVTGREDDKLVSDQCLEDDYDRSEDETTEDEVDEDGYLVLQASQPEEYVIPEEKKKKTKGGKLGDTEADQEDIWSQEQQKLLEAALASFPKGTNERWERIAGKVEGKTKEQCMLRFKFLAEQIKKKKESGDC